MTRDQPYINTSKLNHIWIDLHCELNRLIPTLHGHRMIFWPNPMDWPIYRATNLEQAKRVIIMARKPWNFHQKNPGICRYGPSNIVSSTALWPMLKSHTLHNWHLTSSFYDWTTRCIALSWCTLQGKFALITLVLADFPLEDDAMMGFPFQQCRPDRYKISSIWIGIRCAWVDVHLELYQLTYTIWYMVYG